MIVSWRKALARVETDSSINALVVTGIGKAFCAGGDMDELEVFMLSYIPRRAMPLSAIKERTWASNSISWP